jgi:cell division protease FtsH
MTREELIDELTMLLGGRVAEELIVGDITTGASNDIERATKVARQMVTEYGMSDAIGPLTLGQKQHEVFLGRDFNSQPDYSEHVAFEIDSEVRRLIDDAHDEALEVLQEYRAKLDELAGRLIERETIEREEVEAFLSDIPKRPQRDLAVRGAGLAISRRAVRREHEGPATPGSPGSLH